MTTNSPDDLTACYHERILLFDGVCNLCNGVVQYVIRMDRHDRLKFSALQSEFGQRVLRNLGMPTKKLRSFIYLREGVVYTKSTAFLMLMMDLGGWHRIYAVLWIVPPFLRDLVYALVARTRYGIFGKRSTCYMPTEALQARFMD